VASPADRSPSTNPPQATFSSAAIRVAADTLASSSAGDARAERTARVLRDSSLRLDALVTQFLKLAQAEAGMTGERREPVDLAALCTAVAERMRADGLSRARR
jgi:two-component system sensor histidine kinase ChvG